MGLQLNVDYDLTDQSTTDQGRIVYEPVKNGSELVPQGTWQEWDTRAGRWWGTKASVRVGGVLVTNPCVQSTPCTWTALLAQFPNAGIHSIEGGVILKARPNAGFRGNVDRLVLGIDGANTTFDFEATGAAPEVVPAAPWCIASASTRGRGPLSPCAPARRRSITRRSTRSRSPRTARR